MALSADGFIATKNDETPWSDISWEHYNSFVKKRGNIVMGRRTYDLMREDGTFENMGDPFTVVLGHKKYAEVASAATVLEAERLIAEKGFDEMVVGGGAATNGAFLKEGRIDEIYLDMEPTILGEGIPLFTGAGEQQHKLKLLDRCEEGGVLQLHYKVMM